MKLRQVLVDFLSALLAHVSMLFQSPVKPPPPALLEARLADPSWLIQMKKYVGQSCPTGQPLTDFMRQTFSEHTHFPLKGITPPACAAGLNRCLEEVGLAGTGSAAADSFLKYGKACLPACGAIFVFRWPSGEHHVTLFTGEGDADTVVCLGFNQNHKVQTAVYSRRWIQAMRWPTVRGKS